MRRSKFQLLVAIAFIATQIACGGGGAAEQEGITLSAKKVSKEAKPAATPNGIGPVSELELGEYSETLAAQGEETFTQMCTACHKMDKRHVGPGLAKVLDRRNPAWVMNMILNPEQMVKEDEEAKALFAEYLSPMANQNLTEEQARGVVEYFRKYDRENQ